LIIDHITDTCFRRHHSREQNRPSTEERTHLFGTPLLSTLAVAALVLPLLFSIALIIGLCGSWEPS
jgi:sterol desaturase/sphingolipid hydroxylase (fatty acid hydroxylase superfamily)